MQKFFINSNQINNNMIEINGSDVNHIINVLRLNIGDRIQVCNKDNSQNYVVNIINISDKKEKIKCNIIEEVKNGSELGINISAFQGLPKFDKMELIIQKLTEIGVFDIIPVKMERCVVKLKDTDAVKKIARWQKIAEVAAKQSKRDIIPKINDVIDIKNIISIIKQYDLFIVAYEEEKNITLKSILKKYLDGDSQLKSIGFLVGPEGGVSENEINLLKEAGAKIATLGTRILRTETAPIVIASNIVYELEGKDKVK